MVIAACLAAWSLHVVASASQVAGSIPFGSPGPLDGTIGTEWAQAYARGASVRYQRTSCSCSATYLAVTLRLLHDAENLYIGLTMQAESYSLGWKEFKAVLILDNGDGMSGNVGDNLIIVPAAGEYVAADLDYYYPRYSGNPLRGAQLDAQQDVVGCGAWNSLARTYEIEIRIPLQSGDSCDVAIVPGKPFDLTVGFEAFDRYGKLTHSGTSPVVSVCVAP